MIKKIAQIITCIITAFSLLSPVIVNADEHTYTANYYLETPDHSYEFKESIVYSTEASQVDSTVEKEYAGYKLRGYETPVINSDNSTTCDVYYDLCYYNLEIDCGNYKEYQYLYYNEPITLNTPARDGYTFLGWDQDLKTMPSQDETIHALYSQDSSPIIVTYYLENTEDDTYTLCDYKCYEDINDVEDYDGDDAKYFTFDHQLITKFQNVTVYAQYYRRHHYHLTFNLTIDGGNQYFHSTHAYRCTLTSDNIVIQVGGHTYYNSYTVDVKYGQSLVGLWPTGDMITNNPEGKILSSGIHYLYKVGDYQAAQMILDEHLIEGYDNNDTITYDCYWSIFDKDYKLRYFFNDGNGYIENTSYTEYVFKAYNDPYISQKSFKDYSFDYSNYDPHNKQYRYYYTKKSCKLILVDNYQYHSYTLQNSTILQSYLYSPDVHYKTFTGWYDSQGNCYKDDSTISTDLTLYARYEDRICHVSIVDENNALLSYKDILAGNTIVNMIDTSAYDYFLIDHKCINPEKYIVEKDITIVAAKKDELFVPYSLKFVDTNSHILSPDITGIVKIGSNHNMQVSKSIDDTYICNENYCSINDTNSYSHIFVYSLKTVTLTITTITQDLQDEDQHFVCHLTSDTSSLTFTLVPNTTVEITGILTGSYTFKDENEFYSHYNKTLNLYEDKTLVLDYQYTGNHKWKVDTGKML